MNIPAVDSFFTIYSGFLFFFRFIIFLFRTDKAASYNPARYSPNSLPRVWAIPMLCPGSDVVYCTPNRLPLQLPVAYKPGITSLLLGNLTLSPSALSAFFLQIPLSFSEEIPDVPEYPYRFRLRSQSRSAGLHGLFGFFRLPDIL